MYGGGPQHASEVFQEFMNGVIAETVPKTIKRNDRYTGYAHMVHEREGESAKYRQLQGTRRATEAFARLLSKN